MAVGIDQHAQPNCGRNLFRLQKIPGDVFGDFTGNELHGSREYFTLWIEPGYIQHPPSDSFAHRKFSIYGRQIGSGVVNIAAHTMPRRRIADNIAQGSIAG